MIHWPGKWLQSLPADCRAPTLARWGFAQFCTAVRLFQLYLQHLATTTTSTATRAATTTAHFLIRLERCWIAHIFTNNLNPCQREWQTKITTIISVKIPSEIEVAPRWMLLTLLTLFTLFKLFTQLTWFTLHVDMVYTVDSVNTIYTVYTIQTFIHRSTSSMFAYIYC